MVRVGYWRRIPSSLGLRSSRIEDQVKDLPAAVTTDEFNGLLEIDTATAVQSSSHGVVEISTTAALTTLCPLVDLPPEIRTMIWEYAVTDNRIIVFDRGVPEPLLAFVSKQIRHKSLGLYYKCNDDKFKVHNHDYNPTVYIAIEKKNMILTQFCGVTISVHNKNGIFRQPHWPNLLAWLKAYHAGKAVQKILGPAHGRSVKKSIFYGTMIIGTMFELTADARKTWGWSWEQLLKHFENFHQMLIEADPRWR